MTQILVIIFILKGKIQYVIYVITKHLFFTIYRKLHS